MSRRAPRGLEPALVLLRERLSPPGSLAQVQRAWRDTVGETIAANAEPVAERDGVITVACAASVWAHELELMGPDLTARLNERLGSPLVDAIRCRTEAVR